MWILTRAEEDALLRSADGSCAGCARGTRVPGTGLCVVCHRETGRAPYVNSEFEYDEVTPGPLGVLGSGKGANGGWLSALFDLETSTAATSSPTAWEVVFCAGCPLGVLSFVNCQSARGADRTVMDLGSGRVAPVLRCSKCATPVSRVRCTGDVAAVCGRTLTRCHFCETIVEQDLMRCVQACSGCVAAREAEARALSAACAICGAPAPQTTRNSHQPVRVVCGTGEIVRYLCRAHRIPAARLAAMEPLESI